MSTAPGPAHKVFAGYERSGNVHLQQEGQKEALPSDDDDGSDGLQTVFVVAQSVDAECDAWELRTIGLAQTRTPTRSGCTM